MTFRTRSLSRFAAVALALATACDLSRAPDSSPGVSLELATQRTRSLSNVRYEIFLSIPDSVAEPIVGEETVHFALASARHPVVLDFVAPPENVLAVEVNGRPIEPLVVDEHIVVPAGAVSEGENAVTVRFIAGDGSLNRNDEFLYTLFVPDRARFAIPVFDQPNLKGRFSLSLELPASWRAVANGPAIARDVEGDRVLYRFAETRPISTYLFSFAAGRFQVEIAERDGRRLRMYHRETDRAKVLRNRDAIFDLHASALEWLESYTEIPYPFRKFDFVLIPSFQYGGMEHPGAVLYRASRLFLDESATQDDHLGRASLIAHETAHMWFGDLVTMEWFNDVWMKEVFANFMAAKIVNPSFPDVDHRLRFLLAHYPAAYEVDRTAGANPIRQDLRNLNEAGTLYGAIIYQKAPIVMLHLEGAIGPEDFKTGVRRYLERYAFRNATWPDLIDILDARSSLDLSAWSEIWIDEAGRPTVRTEIEVASGGDVASLRFEQDDPAGERRRWSQQLGVLLVYPDRSEIALARLDDRTIDVPSAAERPRPDIVLPNGLGMGYGLFELDSASLENTLARLSDLPDVMTRGVSWLALWDAMLEGKVPPGRMVDVASRALAVEEDELLIEELLDGLRTLYWRFLSAVEREDSAPGLEALLWEKLEDTDVSTTLKGAFFRTYRDIALTEPTIARLGRIWSGEEDVGGLALSERDYTRLAQSLAVRGVDDLESMLDRQYERIENPDRRDRFAFVRPSLSADPRTRERFFESLRQEASREHEPWVLEGLGYLHHPLRATEAERYITPSLELLEEIQRTGDIFFPKRWLDATLGGHASPAAARSVCDFLASRPDYPGRLRGKILQSADPLLRVAWIVHGFSAPGCIGGGPR